MTSFVFFVLIERPIAAEITYRVFEIKHWAHASEKMLHLTGPSVNARATYFPLGFIGNVGSKMCICVKIALS